MKRKLLFAVNGSLESAMGIRARGLGSGLAPGWHIDYLYRPAGSKIAAARTMAQVAIDRDPDWIYVLDMAVSGVTAALASKLRGLWRRKPRVIVDTGDAITALAQAARLRGQLGIAATWLLEEAGLRFADHIVVRGSRHRELLAERGIRSTWIPDGFEPELFFPPGEIPRSETVTIGLVGSLIWGGDLSSTYGWDLIETLALTPDPRLQGLLVGDGSGLARLRDHAQARGVSQRLEFAGRVPYAELRRTLIQMDICLSTQTNDLPGQVRTTGKLPLYLACGRFILASAVGEAGRVLPANMLIPYNGSRDLEYPAKLAARLQETLARGDGWRAEGLELAQSLAPRFSYSRLSQDLGALLENL